MAFRKLENIDEKIIDATIALGALQQGGRGFATKDIAERCHISEYVIFKHFGNKQTLLALADKKVCQAITEGARDIAKREPDLQSFSASILDWLIQHPDITFFSLNFGHGVPHASETQLPNDAVCSKIWAENGRYIFKADPSASDFDCAFAWHFLLRNLLDFAGFILLKNVEDTPEARALPLRILSEGISLEKEPSL